MRTQKVIPVKIPQMNCSQAGRNCFWQPERKMMLPANKWTGAWLIDCLIRRKLIASQCNNWRIVWVIFHAKIKNAWKKKHNSFPLFYMESLIALAWPPAVTPSIPSKSEFKFGSVISLIPDVLCWVGDDSLPINSTNQSSFILSNCVLRAVGDAKLRP